MKLTLCLTALLAAALNAKDSHRLRGITLLRAHVANASNTSVPNVTGDPMSDMGDAASGFLNATNGTNGTTDDADDVSTTPVPMDGSAVQRPPPQFVVDFCGEHAEQMTACYTWVTTMHGCYTNCKQNAQINTLEADVGGCLAAACGYVPPLICGAADSGGICSHDGPENAESSDPHCDRQCENYLGCVTFQTKGQCATKRTPALFEECYNNCAAPDTMAFTPIAPTTPPPVLFF